MKFEVGERAAERQSTPMNQGDVVSYNGPSVHGRGNPIVVTTPIEKLLMGDAVKMGRQ
jgi:hypothetical protein